MQGPPRSARPASGRRPSQPQVPPLQAADAPAVEPQPTYQHNGQLDTAAAAALSGKSLEAVQPEDVYMDGIIHKLQLLDYEREFCKRKKPYRKGLTPYYFAAAQPGLSGNEQFFYFTSLAVWLLRLCGITLPSPKEFDDPNTTLQGILQGLKSVGFAAPSYAPTKLLAGWGREVCALLDGLADVTLERRGLSRLPKTVFSQDGADEGDAVVEEDVNQDDDAADITSQAAAAQYLATQDSGSDDVALASVLRAPEAGEGRGAQQAAAAEASPVKQVLVSTVDPVAWKLEVERLAPKLRVAVAPDMRDWRQHLEAAHAHMGTLAAAWPDARSQLEQLSSDVSASLDKLEGREQQLTGQFQGLLDTYRESRQQLNGLQEEFSRRTELISERNNELHRVAAALEDAKQQLENRGSNLTDASPLVRLKAAMSSLREELKGMELRIGVVAHNLMSLSLHDKQSALQDAAKRRVKDVTTAKHPVP